MIVKNEAHVIARCISSLRHLIDYYVIVDTGSADETKKVILESMGSIPGEIHDRPWQNFGANRTEAIRLADGKADYLLVIDADDEMMGAPKPELAGKDYYSVLVHEPNGLMYDRVHLFKADSRFKYVGVLHEYLTTPPDMSGALLPSLRYIRHHDGASWTDLKAKYTKDARTLEAALRDDPDNARYQFYLGQSWLDGGEPENALIAYQRRADMPNGWDQEKWFSLLRVATIKRDLKYPEGTVVNAFLRAFEDRPHRLESLYELGRYLQLAEVNRQQLCYTLLKPVIDAPMTSDKLFVDSMVYSWGLKDVFAIAAFYVGDHNAARQINEELLTGGRLPNSEVERVKQNLGFSARSAEQSFTPIRLEKNHLPMDTFFGDFFGRLRKAVAEGGSEFGLGLFLFNLVITIRAESVIEIGRFKGFSTFAMASALKFLTEESWEESPKAKQRPDVDYEKFEQVGGVRKIYSVDPHPTAEAVTIIEENELRKYVKFFDKPSAELELTDLMKRPDIVFIDGDHSVDGCLADVRKFVPMLRPGGYFIVHDYFGWYDANGVNGSPIKRVCDMILAENPNIERVLIDTGYMSFVVFRKSGETT